MIAVSTACLYLAILVRELNRGSKSALKLCSATSDTLYFLSLASPVGTWEGEPMIGQFLTYCRFWDYQRPLFPFFFFFLISFFFSSPEFFSTKAAVSLVYHLQNLWNIFPSFKEAQWKKRLTNRPTDRLIKDVRIHCYCASPLRTKFMPQRHVATYIKCAP